MRIYKCYKNQENRRGPELIGKTGKIFSTPERVSSGSVKDLRPGRYICTDAVSDLPSVNFYIIEVALMSPGTEDRIIKAYDVFTGRLHTLCRTNNIWSTWNMTTLTSDLGYVDCMVTSQANTAVTIPGAPAESNYIPVVIEHNQTRGVMESVFRTSGYWIIYSNQSQEVKVRFYKYPV